MIPTGSRLLLGATALAILAAVVYGTTNGGSLGTTGLISAAAALALLSGINLYTRDADSSSMDEAALTESAAARPAPWSVAWPAVGALGGVLVVVGLVTYPVVFVFGLVALLVCAVEWMISAWSEKASADLRYNAGVRSRFAHPAEYPVLATVAFGIIVYSFSRIMLFLSKASGPAAFGVVAALVLIAGFLVAFRRNLGNSVVAGVASIAVLGLAAGGAAAALAGERDIEAHETIEDVAAEGACSADETEADHDAGRAIADKANLAAEVVLNADGTLSATQTGITGDVETIGFSRSNPTLVSFTNNSDGPRRLVLELGQVPAVDAAGNPIDAETVTLQHCTPLVDKGGTQIMTFRVGLPSAAAGPYRFFVPGVDGDQIEVVVP